VALAIGGGLAVGGAGAAKLVRQETLTATANELIAHLNAARSEAIKRGVSVALCPSHERAWCAPRDGSYTSWESGWILYADNNHNDEADDEEVLYVHRPAAGKFSIRSAGSRSRVIYHPRGTAGGSTITFAICDTADPAQSRYVIVSNTGRPRLSKVTDSKMRCA
jgi:type IV fimbrial biogenesis protein FimT